jgi:hypothetical protein
MTASSLDRSAIGKCPYVIAKIVNGHPNSRIDELLPWAYPPHIHSKTWPENSAYDPSASAAC